MFCHFQPRLVNIHQTVPPWVITPGAGRLALFAALGCQQLQRRSIQGFSTGLMSIARPFACGDSRTGALIWSGRRQLNAEVLSAAMLAVLSPPYSSIGRICRIGNRASNNAVNTVAVSADVSRWTTSTPRR